MDIACDAMANDRRDQLVLGRIGEIVMDKGIALDVDLRGQMAIAVRGDEEVNMRGPIAVAADGR